MPTPASVQEIADLSPLALVLFGVIVGVIGLLRRWWVMGWQYDEKVKQVERLEQRVDELSASLLRATRSDRRRAERDDDATG